MYSKENVQKEIRYLKNLIEEKINFHNQLLEIEGKASVKKQNVNIKSNLFKKFLDFKKEHGPIPKIKKIVDPNKRSYRIYNYDKLKKYNKKWTPSECNNLILA